MAESLCCSPETVTTLLISYTLIPKKKLKKKKPQRDFPDSPVVRHPSSASYAEDTGPISGRGTETHKPHGRPKNILKYRQIFKRQAHAIFKPLYPAINRCLTFPPLTTAEI